MTHGSYWGTGNAICEEGGGGGGEPEEEDEEG